MRKLVLILALLATFFFSNDNLIVRADTNSIKPPVAKKVPKSIRIHGDVLIDNYFWLREKSNPEVISYLEAENAYTDAMTKSTESFQESVYKEMLARIKETDMNVPYREGNYFYHSRTEQGKQYPIYCRKQGDLNAAEEMTLDLNELAKGHKFLSLGAYAVNDSGNLLAYSIDTTGFREYTLFVKDLQSGQLLPERTEKTHSVAWSNDNKTLFYITEDAAKRPYRLCRHTLGQEKDEVIYEEKDEMFQLFVSRSRSRAYLFVTSASLTTSEVRYIPAERPTESLKVLHPREANHEYYVDHHSDLFYIRTNDAGRNFRLVSAPIQDPQKKNWKDIIGHRPTVMLESMNFFANHYVLTEREKGIPKVRITDLKTGQSHYIEFPEPMYSAFPNANREFKTTQFRLSYQSLITPSSIFDYDMNSRKRELLKQTEVLGGYDGTKYQSERIYATASDGTRIPISLVYKKELEKDGTRPMLLTGYGSYGAPGFVTFSSERLSLLNRGVVFAMAHIRGGGEMGKQWHDQGRMMVKRNTFTDFIAAAEHLIAEKYTSKERLIIQGGSAGGLLMGAVVNMRPDLFKAVVSHVPFVDVINTMLDASLPLTVAEFQEWGNPNIKEEYEYIKTYCPYTNLAAKAYPAMLIKTSLNDSQVMYWEPVKYVAKVRSLKTDNNRLLLKTNMAAGHGGASGRYDRLREIAFDYAFILSQFGILK